MKYSLAVRRITGRHHKTFLMRLIKSFISTLIRVLMNLTTSVIGILPKSKTALNFRGGGYRVFCNPPYGREIGKWVKKAYEEGQKENTLVCLLIPARTDTKYFHNYIYNKAEIRFIKGRLHFGGKDRAPFPSMLVIYGGKENVLSEVSK